MKWLSTLLGVIGVLMIIAAFCFLIVNVINYPPPFFRSEVSSFNPTTPNLYLEENKSPVFGLKVVPLDDNACGWWYIEFSNDGFDTKEDIMHYIDLHSWPSEDLTDEDHGMSYIIKHFSDEGQAIRFAKQFDSYEKCVKYNLHQKKQYDGLFEKYSKMDQIELSKPKKIREECLPHETVIY